MVCQLFPNLLGFPDSLAPASFSVSFYNLSSNILVSCKNGIHSPFFHYSLRRLARAGIILFALGKSSEQPTQQSLMCSLSFSRLSQNWVVAVKIWVPVCLCHPTTFSLTWFWRVCMKAKIKVARFSGLFWSDLGSMPINFVKASTNY